MGRSEVRVGVEDLVEFGILQPAETDSSKFKVNPKFNLEDKQSHISFLPSSEVKIKRDHQELKEYGLDDMVGGFEETSALQKMQKYFMDTLRYRIDSKIMKRMKASKSMKKPQLIEIVMADLQL